MLKFSTEIFHRGDKFIPDLISSACIIWYMLMNYSGGIAPPISPGKILLVFLPCTYVQCYWISVLWLQLELVQYGAKNISIKLTGAVPVLTVFFPTPVSTQARRCRLVVTTRPPLTSTDDCRSNGRKKSCKLMPWGGRDRKILAQRLLSHLEEKLFEHFQDLLGVVLRN